MLNYVWPSSSPKPTPPIDMRNWAWSSAKGVSARLVVSSLSCLFCLLTYYWSRCFMERRSSCDFGSHCGYVHFYYRPLASYGYWLSSSSCHKYGGVHDRSTCRWGWRIPLCPWSRHHCPAGAGRADWRGLASQSPLIIILIKTAKREANQLTP